jgi:hypothetical protein
MSLRNKVFRLEHHLVMFAFREKFNLMRCNAKLDEFERLDCGKKA